jgi:hypothetical protein
MLVGFDLGYEIHELTIRQIHPITDSPGYSFIICKDCEDKVTRPLLAAWFEQMMQQDAKAQQEPQAAIDLNEAPSPTN